MEKEISNELKKYKWSFEYQINKITQFTYSVSFPYCNVEFFRDEMYNSVECYLKPNDKKLNNERFSIAEVLKFKSIIQPDLLHNNSSVDIIKFLEQYIRIIFENLLDEIKGGFNVFYKIAENHKNLRLIQDKLQTVFVFETEIYKKMLKGDITWENDLELL